MLDIYPTLPQYTGPYPVGSWDAEIPVSELPPQPVRPEGTVDTISFRVFYPCAKPEKRPKSVYWLPHPQREYLGGYTRFLGASKRISSVLRYLPVINATTYITLPVYRRAQVRPPNTSTKRWPVVVFSHGLGGTRNGYSHICGSLASHGVVVFAPEHRDGSGPVSLVNHADGSTPQHVDYQSIPHRPGKDVEDGRNAQFRIRLWEMSMLHEALLMLDEGHLMTNLSADHHSGLSRKDTDFDMFRSVLDVHDPGRVSWAGHSFGAATAIQLLKSTFHYPSLTSKRGTHDLLYSPSSSMSKQITPASQLILLDLWAMPFDTAATRSLFQKALPGYSDPSIGGSHTLFICSEGFFKWRGNLIQSKRLLSPSPSQENPTLPRGIKGPHIFYPETSAHLSQSDFGVLFLWLTKRALGCQEPERTILLNVRAILEVMRRAGLEVAETSKADREMIDARDETTGDAKILAKTGEIRGWVPLALDVDGPVKQVIERDQRTGPEDAIPD